MCSFRGTRGGGWLQVGVKSEDSVGHGVVGGYRGGTTSPAD